MRARECVLSQRISMHAKLLGGRGRSSTPRGRGYGRVSREELDREVEQDRAATKRFLMPVALHNMEQNARR